MCIRDSLTSRLIDRPIRPLFPKGLYNDVVVIATALSVDTNIPPEPVSYTHLDVYKRQGKIHKRWKPIPGRIKDYIATPKPNMYQSLHTTVVTDFGQPFEIQIRTYEMHRTAEFGIAAHWKYKEKKADDSAFTERLSWIREVLSWEGGLKDSKDFMESLKTELYSSELLVFTPKGKVISLAKDATPIDFAYAIHSEIGNHCVGAKVNLSLIHIC